MSEVEISGWDELMSNLNALPARMEKNILRGAVSQTVNKVRDDLKEAAPVLQPNTVNPHGRRPGQLRDGITGIMLHGAPGTIQGGIRFRIKADVLRQLKSATRLLKKGKEKGVDQAEQALESTRYWTAVEYGHSSKARPFIRNTWDRIKYQLTDFMGEYIGRRLDRLTHD